MASMDSFPIIVGDNVHDTAYGPGRVVTLMSGNRFQVAFPQGRSYVYNDGGVNSRFTIRTLFWRDPVIAVPTKTDDDWTAIRNVCSAVVAAWRANS